MGLIIKGTILRVPAFFLWDLKKRPLGISTQKPTTSEVLHGVEDAPSNGNDEGEKRFGPFRNELK